MKKKGVLGLDTVKLVILTLLILAIFVIVLLVILSPLQTTVESIDITNFATTTNETLTTVTEAGESLNVTSTDIFRNPVCAINKCLNHTQGGYNVTVTPGNYSVTACVLSFIGTAASGFNNSNWKCSYNFTYAKPYTRDLVANISSGGTTFFTYVPTFFMLLAVVVMILIIAIVVTVLSRFREGETSFESI